MKKSDCVKKIYLVGGSVRDKLLNLPNHDKDYVAVGYDERDFSHLPKVGKNFPVFLLPDSSQIALARRETKIAKGYNGFCYQTAQVTLQEDLKRRDLTINAMAFDEENQILIDPFKGQKDLKQKILRHTSEAFNQDPLRVLRIARFRAKFGKEWKIHPSTKTLISSMKEELTSLEPNRVYQEIQKVLALPQSYLFFETLFELDILEILFPSLAEQPSFTYAMARLKNLPKTPQTLKLAALYLDKSPLFKNTSESFKDMQIPKKTQKPMLLLIFNHAQIHNLAQMQPSEILDFFESYRGQIQLFKMQIQLFLSQQATQTSFAKGFATPNFSLYSDLFISLQKLSPKKWIDSKAKPPSADSIKKYLHRAKINRIKSILKLRP